MGRESLWGTTPRQSIAAECARRGAAEVVAGCVALIDGGQVGDPHVDVALVYALGGPAADWVLGGGPVHAYWLRVWGVRGLLWNWDDVASPAIRSALGDPAWRVRELAGKVIARHELGDLLPDVAALREDPTPRVARAAARAVATLTQAGA